VTKIAAGLTFFLLINSVSFAQDSESISQIQFGFGVGIGIINPTEYYEYVDGLTQDNSYESTTSFDNMSFSPRVFVGYRINNLAFRLSGEYGLSWKIVHSGDMGDSFYFNRLSSGFETNYYFPIKSKIGLLAGGGIFYHNIFVDRDKQTLFSENTLGYRLQIGFNFFPNKKITLQGLIAYNYAKAEDQGMELNYSGLNIRFNIIFGKSIF